MEILKCGCNAMAQHNNAHDGLEAGHPTCIVHSCCEIAQDPDLTGRRMRCAYYGNTTYKNECRSCKGVCSHESESSLNTPFFQYKPEQDFDEFYCGCRSWD